MTIPYIMNHEDWLELKKLLREIAEEISLLSEEIKKTRYHICESLKGLPSE